MEEYDYPGVYRPRGWVEVLGAPYSRYILLLLWHFKTIQPNYNVMSVGKSRPRRGGNERSLHRPRAPH
jgi:hypothetical protein